MSRPYALLPDVILEPGVFFMAANTTIVGWIPSGTDRGSIDILWSCCVTIILCCWVSVYPNVPSINDKWYHPYIDKLNLAFIGLLGPDFLFGIALGQLASARRNVRLFLRDPDLLNGRQWTLVHAFFADMGGFVLKSPDFSDGFPINGEQLYYLVKHKHLDFPCLTEPEIKGMDKADMLSKVITIWQVLWFTTTELWRASIGLPMTTLELTALSFSGVMVATSVCWYRKPSISRPTILQTKDNVTVEDIRAAARNGTHPGLPYTYYRTPLDFISRRPFHADTHWSYYIRLTQMAHMPLFSRTMKSPPWDRFPSDMWLPIDETPLIEVLASIVLLGFSISFSAGWYFYFPTPTERKIWRVCSVYHAISSVLGGAYYLWGPRDMKPSNIQRVFASQDQESESSRKPETTAEEVDMGGILDPEARRPRRHFRRAWRRCIGRLKVWLKTWRNISVDQDPAMEVPRGRNALIFIACFLYALCRLYFYVEDFIGLRSQPAGIYQTVNRFIPFLGS